MSLPGDVPVPPQHPLFLQTKFNEDFTVKAEGTGKGTMTVVTIYNAKVPDKDNKCDNFDLQVQVEDVNRGESPTCPPNVLTMSICIPPHVLDEYPPLHPMSPSMPPMSPRCPHVPPQARNRMASSAPSRSPSAPGRTGWGRWGHQGRWS